MTAEARDIILDAHNTTVEFRVRWFGMLTVSGRFDALHGVLALPCDGFDEAAVTIDVDAASVNTGIGLRDRHLRGPRFLDAAQHPHISFRSSRVTRQGGTILVEGKLAVRGIEHFVISRCPVDEAEPARGHGMLSVAGTITVSRRRFEVGMPLGLSPFTPMLAAIADDVEVSIRVAVPATRVLPAFLPALGR